MDKERSSSLPIVNLIKLIFNLLYRLDKMLQH